MPISGRAVTATVPINRANFVDMSTQPLIALLLANPDARRYYLLHAEPYDWDGEATVDRYFSSGISRVPGHDALWKPRLVHAFNVETQLFDGPFGIGGGGRPAFGAIQIAIGDEGEVHEIFRDELTWLLWNRRQLTLYLGGDPDDGWTFADYVVVFSGLAEEATWNEDLFTIIVRDQTVRLEVPMQETLYEGTGGLEGGVDLKGKPKPLAYGRPRGISPVLIDRTYLIYEVHDREILAFDAVYDKGDEYTFAGLSIDLYDEPSMDVGTYKWEFNTGRFRLGSTPNGLVTCDIQGDVQGASNLNETQGSMIKRILKRHGGFTDAEIDLGALAALDANNREVSLYLREPINISAVIDEILRPNGYRTFDSTGRFTAGRVEIGVPVLTLAPPRILSILRERTRLPSWRISMGYSRNWTLMTETDLAVLGVELDRDFATNEYRRVVVEDATIKTRVPGAFDDTIDTLWNDELDAQDEVDELFALTSADRNIYRVEATRIQFRLRAGQTVTIRHARFGLDRGQSFIILGIAENTTTGITSLFLWG